jgi:hypothetical protein
MSVDENRDVNRNGKLILTVNRSILKDFDVRRLTVPLQIVPSHV